MTIPFALIRVILVFGFIVLLSRFRIDLGIAILLGALALGLSFGERPINVAISISNGLIDPLTIILIVLVFLILILNRLMGVSGAQQRLVNSVSSFANSRKVSLAALPAIIGLLPMPGGAFFSAPMVEEVSKGLPVTQEWRTVVNYWFRHIWEFWWPMYPGVILAVSLSGIPVSTYITHMFIMTIVAIGAGYLLLFKTLKISEVKKERSWGSFRNLLYHSLPVTIILVIMALFNLLSLPLKSSLLFSNTFSQYYSMFVGLIIASAWVVFSGKLGAKAVFWAIVDKKILSLLLLITATMAYRRVLSDSGAVLLINKEMQALNIPVVAVTIILPFIAGLVMAIAVGFVGVSFPVVIGIIDSNDHFISLVALAYISGYTGMMISPIHMCLVLTKNHFSGAQMAGIYKILIPLCASVFAIGLLYCFLMLSEFL